MILDEVLRDILYLFIYFVINKIKIIKKTNKPINPPINLLGANPLHTTRLAIFQTLVINVLCA